MSEIFQFFDNAAVKFRSGLVLEWRHNRTNNFAIESISTLRAKMLVLVPENLRQSTSLNSFKQGTKTWNPINPCRLSSKTYVHKVGFIWLIIPVAEIE